MMVYGEASVRTPVQNIVLLLNVHRQMDHVWETVMLATMAVTVN